MSRDYREAYEESQKTVELLQAELERLSQPPFLTGTILDLGKKTIQVAVDGGGVYEVVAGEKLKLGRGHRIVLNPKTSAIVDHSEFNNATGELAVVDEVFDGRLRLTVKGEPKYVLSALNGGVKAGDEVLLDRSGMIAIGKSDSKKTKYNLEEVPTAPWDNVGGLEEVIDKIKSEVEEPFLHKEVFERYGRKAAKGILLYGPPGCGKTMIAKSIAYNLAKLTSKGKGNGHFINVKGPEILEKWVGNSEANIRRIYAAARETAAENGAPVVVFIDEAESVLKTRGSGISTDVYDSIVPQFLAELDGINGNGNVMTVLATNREDILDPAVLRDGRVDRRIKVPRPNEQGAREIFTIYLKDKPISGGFLTRKSADELARDVASGIYKDGNVAYRVVSPREGAVGNFGYRHIVSGAMIKGIVDRACGYAIKREIDGGKKGLTRDDLEVAVRDEFADNLGFTQALVRDDWESVFGAKGKQYLDLFRQGYLVLEREDVQTKSDGGKK